jgi:Uma2 family endonuclease
MVSALQQMRWTFEEFVAAYLEDSRYELIDGELIDLEPTGPHEKVAGFVSRKLNVQIDQFDLPWFIPNPDPATTPQYPYDHSGLEQLQQTFHRPDKK